MSAYRRLMAVALLLPVVLMMAMMSWMQYRAQRDALLGEFESLMQRRVTEVDGITVVAEEHVINMRHWMEGDLAMAPPSYPAELHKMLTPRRLDGRSDGFTLDELAPAARDYLGQFMWVADRQPTQADLNRFAYFSGPASMAHALKPYFAWSYFFSAQADVFIVYPWTPVRTLVDEQGNKSLRKTMTSWLDYDIFKLGVPARNPTRSAYWVDPYVDAGGKGLMVSHAAPVSGPDGGFRGIVGTDVLLDTLQDMAMSWRGDRGRWWVVTSSDLLLADSGGALIKPGDKEVPPLKTRLGARVTMDDVHRMNAAHASEHAGVSKAGAIDLLRRNSDAAAAAIRALDDEDLDRAAPVSLYDDAPLTCQFVLEDHAVRHSYHHLAVIRRALGR